MATFIILFCAFVLLPLTILGIGKGTEAIFLYINREKYSNNEIDIYMIVSFMLLMPFVLILPLFFDFDDAKANVFYEKATGYCSTQIIIDLSNYNTAEKQYFIKEFTPLLSNYQRKISKSSSYHKGYSYSTATIPVYYTIENNQFIIQLAGKIENPMSVEWLRYVDGDIQVNQNAHVSPWLMYANEVIQVNQIADFSPWLSSQKWTAIPISSSSRNLVKSCSLLS